MAKRKFVTKKLPEAARVPRKYVSLDPAKHGVGGVIRGTTLRFRKQDKRATPADGYAVVFFPRVRGIGKAHVGMFGLDRSLSSSPEAAITKFMDGIARSETWKKMSQAGHRVRRLRIADLGDA